MMQIPFIQKGDSGPPLHLAHANGFPPEAYEGLLDQLCPDFRVYAWKARPLWPGSQPSEIKNWSTFRDDLLRFFGQIGERGWIGVGHSLGGVASMMAALQAPELFQALVVIDPPLFLPWESLAWKLISRIGMAHRLHPLVKGTLRRRTEFDSRRALFSSYRKKRIFQFIDDPNLWAYVNAIGKERAEGGVALTYSPQCEARIYVTGILFDSQIWKQLDRLAVPLLLVRPTYAPAFSDAATEKLLRQVPQASLVTIPASTHLVPLERPREVAEAVRSWLDSRPQGS